MSKLELEKNEEAVFNTWLKGMDEKFDEERRMPDVSAYEDPANIPNVPLGFAYFERNLEVWRQLWRVTELSSVLLVLLDVRIPLLHLPPSLSTYLENLKPKKQIVLVLSKCDLVPRSISAAWKESLEKRFTVEEGWRVVRTPAEGDLDGSKTRRDVVEAIRHAHEDLLKPHPRVAEDPVKLAKWTPRVCEVDWDRVQRPESVDVTAAIKSMQLDHKIDDDQRPQSDDEDEDEAAILASVPSNNEVPKTADATTTSKTTSPISSKPPPKVWRVDPFLTIGLVGQPNVGKSSLINTLFTRPRVRASMTPGKTKHFQTLFLRPDLRVTDCPGLVCPSWAGMERQVLASVIPVQSAEAVVGWVGKIMPLEKALGLKALDSQEAGVTNDELLSAVAERKNFITAKAGRPDVNRAAVFILRNLYSNTIPWALRPVDPSGTAAPDGLGSRGAWVEFEEVEILGEKRKWTLDDKDEEEEEEGSDGVEERGEHSGSEGEADGSEDEEEDEDEDSLVSETVTKGGAFALLGIEDGEEDESEEDSDDE